MRPSKVFCKTATSGGTDNTTWLPVVDILVKNIVNDVGCYLICRSHIPSSEAKQLMRSLSGLGINLVLKIKYHRSAVTYIHTMIPHTHIYTYCRTRKTCFNECLIESVDVLWRFSFTKNSDHCPKTLVTLVRFKVVSADDNHSITNNAGWTSSKTETGKESNWEWK